MTDSPYRAFKEKLCTFADGQAGIRNPFVIVAVEPAIEHRTVDRLSGWATGSDEPPVIDEDISIQPIWLDELLPQTKVYNLCVALGSERRARNASRARCRTGSPKSSSKR